MAVPGKLDGVVPSPQLTLMDEMIPSGSVAVKVTVTVWPVSAGFGLAVDTVTVGGRSFTTSVAVADPGPALFVAVTVIVKFCDLKEPVFG